MKGSNNMEEYPKGMSIPVENIDNFFTQQPKIKENIKLKDLNYAKIIVNKLNEIEDFEIELENLTVNEMDSISSLLLSLKIFKKGSE